MHKGGCQLLVPSYQPCWPGRMIAVVFLHILKRWLDHDWGKGRRGGGGVALWRLRADWKPNLTSAKFMSNVSAVSAIFCRLLQMKHMPFS